MTTRVWILVIAVVGFFAIGWFMLRRRADDAQRADDRAIEEARRRELRRMEQEQAGAMDAAAHMTMQEYERGLGEPLRGDAGPARGDAGCRCLAGDPLCSCL